SRPVLPGYDVLDRLGRGGAGVVWRARHLATDRLVAVKLLRSGVYARRDERDRFAREARALAPLRHPHAVQISDVGEQAGSPFLVLEYVDGGSLAALVRDHPLPPRRAAELVRQLALAVHEAHQQGIVHRDLKPENVLLTVEGQPKVTDFGLVKDLGGGGGATRTHAVLGTPRYLAP